MSVSAQARGALRGAAFVALIGALWAGYWIASVGERERNRQINPAVYPAFRAIEQSCLAEDWPRRTVRCQEALDFVRACSAADRGCGALDYYGALIDAGFELPPLYSVRR